MTRAQWVILLRLKGQPGLSQKELAEIVEVEPITVARLIDRLEERGMVERRDDPNDRRIWRLHLCPPAEPVLADLAGERTDMLRSLSLGLDAEALAAIEAGLRQMKTNVAQSLRHKALEKALEKVSA